MIAQLDPLYIKISPTKAVIRFISEFVFEGRPIPRRWRWTNNLNVLLFKLGTLIPEARLVKKPIFILGAGRSGTTILGKVLSMHRDVGFLNEPKLLWHVAYPDEDIIGSYSRGEAHYRLETEYATEDVIRVVHRIYGFYLAVTGSKRILDKYPEMIFRVPFVLSIFPDAKFILIVRNGADLMCSVEWWCNKYSKVARNGESYDWWGINQRKWGLLLDQIVALDPAFMDSYEEIRRFSRQVDMAAVEWIATMREGLQIIDKFPQKIYLIHYEELANRPLEILNKALEFCELPTDEALLTYASNVLSQAPVRAPIELNPSIQPLFAETMKSMGYG